MAAHVPEALVLADALCCLGLGLLLAVGYDAARWLLGSSRPVCFVLDLTVFACAAVLLHSFAAGRSYSGAVRWYMAAGAAAGLWGYFFVLAPGLGALRSLAEWFVLLPVRLIWITAVRPVGRLCGRRLERTRKKLHSAVVKRQTKQLQKKAKVLYNSNQYQV
ncbi:hypothetical protein [Allofournierella massiliensis]|uniref:hypothetical protein n=1 Tax=Allofournierella massiliensis TaxID=1650663 RepID=UPI0024B03C5B|nr:hypothetical protein [Fournierella massiliensis]